MSINIVGSFVSEFFHIDGYRLYYVLLQMFLLPADLHAIFQSLHHQHQLLLGLVKLT